MTHSPHPLASGWFGLLTNPSRRHRLVGFGVTLAIAAIYAVLAMQQAFADAYVVQDDARQHIFWMQRFVDPDLFPHDLIADYFQGVAPLGYRWLYHLAATLGIHPIFFSKILPLFLGLVTTSYCYWVTLELFPIPLAGFISALSFSQSIWYSSEHASATPRAFLYPLLFAFIYYVIREKPLIYLASLTLQTLFYPQISLICLGVLGLRLIERPGNSFMPKINPQRFLQFGLGFCLVGAILLFTQGQTDFGEVISRAAAIAQPEFQPGGRNAFFEPGLDYWLNGRSGLFHERGFTPATLIAGLVLPLLVWLPIQSQFRKLLSAKTVALLQILIVSFGLFGLAHLLLFQLHLPSRYTSHTLRAVMGLTCGISLVIMLDDCSRVMAAAWVSRGQGPSTTVQPFHRQIRAALFAGAATLLAFFILAYPVCFFERFPKVGYYNFAAQHKLYEYFSAQPKDSVIASLSVETSNIPVFSARTVLVSPEHAIAYHQGYYGQFRQRAEDLIQSQYTVDAALLSKVMARYGIDFWLIDKAAFQPSYISENDWLRQYQPMADEAIAGLQNGQQSVLQQAVPMCTVARDSTWTILAGRCVDNFAKKRTKRLPKAS